MVMIYDDDDAMQADVEDLLIVMEARPEHEKGLDFVLEGGRERGPIIVSSVTPGMFFLYTAPAAWGDLNI